MFSDIAFAIYDQSMLQ